MIPNATHTISEPGYDHLDVDDQPRIGINGITPEQRLWHLFHLERTRRFILTKMRSTKPVAQISWQRQVEAFDSLPKDH